MRNILIFFFLLCTATLAAQIDTVTTIGPEYPTVWRFQKDFQNEPNTTGAAGLNGGVISYSADSTALRVVVPAATGGVEFQYSYTGGVSYTARINVKALQSPLTVLSQWAVTIGTITEPGVYTYTYTAPAAAGAFGRELIIRTAAGSTYPDTFYINRVDIWERNPDALIYDNVGLQSQVTATTREALLNTGLLYWNDFSENLDGVAAQTTPAPTRNETNQTVDVTFSSGQIISFAANRFRDTMSFRVCLEVTAMTAPIEIGPVWGVNSSGFRTITAPGVYCYDMERAGIQASSPLDGVVLRTYVTSSTASIAWVAISEVGRDANYIEPTQIGRNISTPNRYSGQHVIYGSNVTVTNTVEGVFVGDQIRAGGEWTRRFGNAYLLDEGVSIGNRGYNAHARTTGVGSEHVIVGQSATGIGSGVENYRTHGFAAGRGAYLAYYPHQNDLATFGGNQAPSVLFAEKSLQLGNGYWHKSPTPVSGQTRGDAVPNTVELKIYGQDAFDARHPAWDAGKTYKLNDVVFRNDSIWFSNGANTASPPDAVNADWTFWIADTAGAAADFNVGGGDLGFYAGRATGTGESGSLKYYVAEGNNGPNTKDTPKLAGEYRSDESQTTGTFLWLLNEATGTMQRVVIDTKPAVSGSNGIVGFSKGYKPE